MPGENENILIRVVDDDAHMRGSLDRRSVAPDGSRV